MVEHLFAYTVLDCYMLQLFHFCLLYQILACRHIRGEHCLGSLDLWVYSSDSHSKEVQSNNNTVNIVWNSGSTIDHPDFLWECPQYYSLRNFHTDLETFCMPWFRNNICDTLGPFRQLIFGNKLWYMQRGESAGSDRCTSDCRGGQQDHPTDCFVWYECYRIGCHFLS